MKELFNKEAVEGYKTKIKATGKKLVDWCKDHPEEAFYAALLGASTLVLGETVHSLRVSNKCERERSKAYCDYLDRQ